MAFVGSLEPVPVWSRPALFRNSEIFDCLSGLRWLSNQTRAELCILAECLRDWPAKLADFAHRHPRLTTRCLTLAGLDYSLGLFAQTENSLDRPLIASSPVYLVVQTKLLADIGGAGIPYIGRIPMVRLVRGAGVMSHEEQETRFRFHTALLSQLGADMPLIEGARGPDAIQESDSVKTGRNG